MIPESTSHAAHRTMPLAVRVAGLAAVAALTLAGCSSGSEPAGFTDGSASPSAAASEDSAAQDGADEAASATTENDGALVAEIDDPVEFEVCKKAEESETATVTWLEDKVIEESEISAGADPKTVETDDGEIEIPGAPAVMVPERVAQAGCIIEYDAPGGCLPAVEISGSYIPGYRVPSREIPAVELPGGGTNEALVQDELSKEAVEQDGARAEQVCQIDESEASGRVVAPVTRGPITRGPITVGPLTAGPRTQPPANTDAGFIPGYTLTGMSVPGQSVPGASVPGASLPGYVLDNAEGTNKAERDEQVYYTTEGDVLFDADSHELSSAAGQELQAVADDMAALVEQGDVEMTVEGHTDNVATSAYDDNQDLSEQRAASVADWLVSNAGVEESAITVEGLGEEHPRASNNTDEGRQQNRRVVITVTPEGYEPEVDYETESGN